MTISAGGYFTCATLSSGVAYCWGFNEFGSLGGSWVSHDILVVSSLVHVNSPVCCVILQAMAQPLTATTLCLS